MSEGQNLFWAIDIFGLIFSFFRLYQHPFTGHSGSVHREYRDAGNFTGMFNGGYPFRFIFSLPGKREKRTLCSPQSGSPVCLPPWPAFRYRLHNCYFQFLCGNGDFSLNLVFWGEVQPGAFLGGLLGYFGIHAGYEHRAFFLHPGSGFYSEFSYGIVNLCGGTLYERGGSKLYGLGPVWKRGLPPLG